MRLDVRPLITSGLVDLVFSRDSSEHGIIIFKGRAHDLQLHATTSPLSVSPSAFAPDDAQSR